MSHRHWRALRAVRVILACLVLWLPARSAAASLGPVDTVVMIAGAASGAGTGGSPARSATRDDRGARDAAERQHFSASASAIDSVARQACRADRGETANRTVVERLYLHCCVFLR